MDVAALVALAGNTLVTAAVTDAWEDVRGKVARLFGRGKPDSDTVRRLDATRGQLELLAPPELQQVREDLARRWAGRFADLLDDYPEAEAELRSLVEEIRAQVPGVSASGHSLAAGRDIRITAADGGFAAGVVHGDVAPPHPLLPGPAGGQPGPERTGRIKA